MFGRLLQLLHHAAGRGLAGVALLALIAAGTLFFRLGSLPLTGADEPRYARIAAEMLENGRWVTPTLQGRPWLEKPPLYYWITIPAYALAGPGEASARVGSAVLALLSALTLAWLGARIWSRLAGMLAGAVMLTCVGIAAFGRSASTDMPLTACMTIALALLGGAALRDRQPRWLTFTGWFFLGLAILAKGPVAPLLAAGILGAFWCLDERGGSLRRWQVLPGIAFCVLVASPWFWLAFRENGYSFLAVFFVNHNLSRFVTDIHHHTEPFYFYIPVLLGLMFPWSGWFPILARISLRNWRALDRRALFLVCWAAIPFLFFSLSRSKLPGYILPIIPALALLMGATLAEWIESGEFGRRVRAAAALQALLSLGMCVALPIVFAKSYGQHWFATLPLSVAVAVPALAALIYVRRRDARRAVAAVVCQGLLLVLALTQFAYPALGRYHSTREIAQKLVSVREAGEPAVTFRFFHHTLHYYTGYGMTADLGDLEALRRRLAAAGRVLVVTEARHLPEIALLDEAGGTVIAQQGKLRLLRLRLRPGLLK